VYATSEGESVSSNLNEPLTCQNRTAPFRARGRWRRPPRAEARLWSGRPSQGAEPCCSLLAVLFRLRGPWRVVGVVASADYSRSSCGSSGPRRWPFSIRWGRGALSRFRGLRSRPKLVARPAASAGFSCSPRQSDCPRHRAPCASAASRSGRDAPHATAAASLAARIVRADASACRARRLSPCQLARARPCGS